MLETHSHRDDPRRLPTARWSRYHQHLLDLCVPCSSLASVESRSLMAQISSLSLVWPTPSSALSSSREPHTRHLFFTVHRLTLFSIAAATSRCSDLVLLYRQVWSSHHHQHCQTLVCVILFIVGGLYWTGATTWQHCRRHCSRVSPSCLPP
jgi:hypothetical protein